MNEAYLIVGGVVGGIVVVTLTLLLFFLCRRSQKRSQEVTLSPASPVMTPFTAHYELDPCPAHVPDPSYGALPLWTSDSNQGTSQANIRAAGKHAAPLSNVIHRDSGARYPQDDVVDVLPPRYSE
jgi:hypothetical protein